MTPTTKAGQALRQCLETLGIRDPERGLIVDAEAEARVALLAEIRREVEALSRNHGACECEGRNQVLALLDRLAASPRNWLGDEERS